MSKVRPSTQLAQDGAATGAFLAWNGSAWVPGSIGRDKLTAAGGETTLTLGGYPTPNAPIIWKNSSLLWPTDDYTISASTIVFNTALSAADVIRVWYMTADTPAASIIFTAATGGPYGLAPYGLSSHG